MPQNLNKPAEPCPWCTGFDLYRQYHDEEWGLPLRNDHALFELLILEGAQAGLSWSTVLKKRAHYRLVFDGFQPEIIASYNEAKVALLLTDPGIIRNRAKIASTILNAKAYLAIKTTGKSFSDYLWQFVENSPIQNSWSSMDDVPSSTPESVAMSKALFKLGFKFVGPTICYAFMQACGMVNDHLVSCPRHKAVQIK